jgi:cytochrome b involved in lipid metabolism
MITAIRSRTTAALRTPLRSTLNTTHHVSFANNPRLFSVSAANIASRRNVLLLSTIVGAATGMSLAKAEGPKKDNAWMQTSGKMDEESQSLYDDVMAFLGLKSPLASENGETVASAEDTTDDEDDESQEGPGKPVRVPLDPELVESLPLLPRSVLTSPTGEYANRHLVSYQGIIYDITEFIHHHPGGKDLALTASGLDLHHFFSNYIVHGETAKAANWLASLAIGKLSDSDAKLSKERTDAKAHVQRRHVWLNRARRRMIVITASLPFWMTIRSAVRMVGSLSNRLGRWLAYLVPVSVPGLTTGAEPLPLPQEEGEAPSVAVIGGGIAGCGAAWALRLSGYNVTLFEAREQISGNARTFDWDFGPYRSKNEERTVKSCCSVTAW